MNTISLRLCSVVLALAGIILTSTALKSPAADGSWTYNTSTASTTSWTSSANWLNGIMADGVDATAYITNNNGANNTITLDGDRILGHILFADNNTGNHDRILAPGSGGVLTMQVSSGMPSLVMSRTNNGDAFYVDLTMDIAGTQGLLLVGDGDVGRAVSGRFRFFTVAKSYAGDTVLTNGASVQLDNGLPDGSIPDGPGKGDLHLWNSPGGAISELRLNQASETVNGLWGNGSVYKANAVASTLTVGNNDASSTFSGTFSDDAQVPFTLRKIGAGTFTFEGSASGTFTGTFLADGGTLAIGSAALLPMGCTLAGGAGQLDVSTVSYWPQFLTVTGTGAISGPVTVDSGTVSPGFGAGTLTLNNSLTYAGMLAWPTNLFDLDSVTTEGAGVNDLLLVNGNIDLNYQTVQVVFRFTGPSALPTTTGQYTIIRYTGSLLNGGGFAAAGLPSFITPTFDTSVQGEVRVSFTYTLSNQNLVWTGNDYDNYWDTWSFNWNSATAQFAVGDTVTFDDTGSTNPPVNLREPLLAGAVTVNSSKDYVFGGPGYLYGTMGLTKSGSGTLVITSNANAYAGTTLINSGILQVQNTSALGLTNGPTIVSSGATLDLGAVVGLEPISVSGNGVTVGGTNLGALTRTGTGLADDTARDVTLTGDTTLGAWGDRWDINPLAESDPGLRGNGRKLTKVGSAQLSIVGMTGSTNVWDSGLGDIEVKEGTLQFGRSMTMGQPNKSLVVHSNAQLLLYGTAVTNVLGQTNVLLKNVFMTNATLTLNGGANTFGTVFGGPVQVNGNCTFSVGSPNGAAITGVVSGPGSVRKTGGQPLALTAANTFTGPLIQTQNRLLLGNISGQCLATPDIIIEATNGLSIIDLLASEQINDNAVITLTNAVVDDGRFVLKGYNETIAGLRGNKGTGTNQVFVQAASGTDGDSNLLSTLTLKVPAGASHDFGGNLRDFGASAPNSVLTLVKDGPGTQIFSGQANHSGTTTVSAGTLLANGTNNVLANSSVVLAGGTLQFSGPGTTGLRTNVDITGTGSFVKDGPGTITLAAGTLNTFTGPTTIKAGVLRVDGTLGSGTGTVTVQGGTLAGSGTIHDPVTIQAGGQLSPGISVGFMNMTRTLTLQGTTRMEISKVGPTILIHDQVYGLTQINNGGNLVVTDLGATPAYAAGDAFHLFVAGSYQGTFASVTLPTLPPGLRWNTDVLNTAGILSIEADSSIPTDPTNVTFSVSSGNLTLGWPENYTGWALQSQTNVQGIQTNASAWFPVLGSEATNLWTIPMNPANPPVFYRLFYQPTP